jgi:hypothetical protein
MGKALDCASLYAQINVFLAWFLLLKK